MIFTVMLFCVLLAYIDCHRNLCCLICIMFNTVSDSELINILGDVTLFWNFTCYVINGILIYTVSHKSSTFKLSVTLSNVNRFSKFLHCWKAYEICYKTHTTVPTSPQACCYTTLKLKIQIFCRYSADMSEMQMNCILIDSNFVIHSHILIFLVLK